jgi:uncharacterized protein (UPF0332 family)
MISQNVRTLVIYRIEQADESLEAARLLLDQKMLRPSVNRAYYAMFYAVLALLAVIKKETSKHSGALSLFDREFVKPGIFNKELSRWLHNAFDLRQVFDYAPQSSITLEDAKLVYEHAKEFVQQVKSVYEKKYEQLNGDK